MIYAKAAFTIAYFILSKAYSEREKLKQSSSTKHTSEQIIEVHFNLSGNIFFKKKSQFRMKFSLYLPLY